MGRPMSERDRMVREAAVSAATQMAEEGDPTVLATAAKLASGIKQLSVEGALEAMLAVSLHVLSHNGHAAEVARVRRALQCVEWRENQG